MSLINEAQDEIILKLVWMQNSVEHRAGEVFRGYNYNRVLISLNLSKEIETIGLMCDSDSLCFKDDCLDAHSSHLIDLRNWWVW